MASRLACTGNPTPRRTTRARLVLLHFGYLRPLRSVEASLAIVGRNGTFRTDKTRFQKYRADATRFVQTQSRDFSFKAGTSICATCRSSAYEWRPSRKRSAAPRWAPSALIPLSDCDGPPPHRAFDVRNLLKEARNAIPVWIQELRHFPGRCWQKRHARSLAACRRARRGMSFRLQLLVHPLLKLRRAGSWIRYGFRSRPPLFVSPRCVEKRIGFLIPSMMVVGG